MKIIAIILFIFQGIAVLGGISNGTLGSFLHISTSSLPAFIYDLISIAVFFAPAIIGYFIWKASSKKKD